jgi:hypothetical protein
MAEMRIELPSTRRNFASWSDPSTTLKNPLRSSQARMRHGASSTACSAAREAEAPRHQAALSPSPSRAGEGRTVKSRGDRFRGCRSLEGGLGDVSLRLVGRLDAQDGLGREPKEQVAACVVARPPPAIPGIP